MTTLQRIESAEQALDESMHRHILAMLADGPRRLEAIAGALFVSETTAARLLIHLELANKARRLPGLPFELR